MRRIAQLTPFIVALLIALGTMLFASGESQAAGGRMREVGGWGLVLRNSPTFSFGSLDSAVNGNAKAGEIVYINGWQIGVYHIGDMRWIASAAVQPIIDAAGRPIANSVSVQGGTYYMNGRALSLPARRQPQADRFLANPDINAPIVYQGSSVPVDYVGDMVDPSAVWYGSGEQVLATMRVTSLYDYIYLRTAPSDDAPQASFNAYAGELLTAYEIVGDRWYRIGKDVWAPRTYGNEVLMVPENVTGYAPAEYYNGGKWISIDLGRQRLTAWEGKDVVVTSPIKSGKYGYHTPTGTYKIYEKIANERMSGSDYDLMDVAWTMYFTNSRIAIHSAYWHNNYNGRPGSHGCVNTPVALAKQLFMWAPNGTTVVSHNPYVYDQIDIANANKWNQYAR